MEEFRKSGQELLMDLWGFLSPEQRKLLYELVDNKVNANKSDRNRKPEDIEAVMQGDAGYMVENVHANIRSFLEQNPEAKFEDIVKKFS